MNGFAAAAYSEQHAATFLRVHTPVYEQNGQVTDSLAADHEQHRGSFLVRSTSTAYFSPQLPNSNTILTDAKEGVRYMRAAINLMTVPHAQITVQQFPVPGPDKLLRIRFA